MVKEQRMIHVMKWFYRGGHPNRMARLLNRCSAAVYALGIALNELVSLEVVGRRSGRIIRMRQPCQNAVQTQLLSTHCEQRQPLRWVTLGFARQ